jgi:hypothetical protein
MELLIFSLFCFFNIILYITAVIKRNLFLGITSGIILIVLGTFLVSEGLVITTHETVAQSWLQQTVGNSTVFNTSSSILSGFTDVITTYKNTFTDFMGYAFWILGLGSFVLSITYGLKGSEEPV